MDLPGIKDEGGVPLPTCSASSKLDSEAGDGVLFKNSVFSQNTGEELSGPNNSGDGVGI